MMGLHSRTLSVENYDELRDNLPSSGLFDMTDCAIEIWCPADSEVSELQRMTTLIESMVHVTDVKIGTSVEELESQRYRIVFTEDAKKSGPGRFTKER